MCYVRNCSMQGACYHVCLCASVVIYVSTYFLPRCLKFFSFAGPKYQVLDEDFKHTLCINVARYPIDQTENVKCVFRKAVTTAKLTIERKYLFYIPIRSNPCNFRKILLSKFKKSLNKLHGNERSAMLLYCPIVFSQLLNESFK